MTFSVVSDPDTPANPLDLVEQLVTANDWPFDRRSDHEMAVEVPGRWCDYSLYFAWREEVGALHITCVFDMKVPAKKRPAIHELLAMVNEKMWLGHFGLWADEAVPMYRHAMLVRGPLGASTEHIEDLVEIALAECERFYPSFQFVIWGGKSPAEAVAASMLETMGEA